MDREAAESSFERLAVVQSGHAGVARRRMFGREGLTVNGKFFAFLDTDRLLLKLPQAKRDALLTEGHAASAVSVSPTMNKWVAVPYASRAADWDALTDEARQFVAQSADLT
jgi:TfoX/Sxy family transcriptional regulator of competence genes